MLSEFGFPPEVYTVDFEEGVYIFRMPKQLVNLVMITE